MTSSELMAILTLRLIALALLMIIYQSCCRRLVRLLRQNLLKKILKLKPLSRTLAVTPFGKSSGGVLLIAHWLVVCLRSAIRGRLRASLVCVASLMLGELRLTPKINLSLNQ